MGDDVERNQQKREMGRVALGLIALFFVYGAVATFSERVALGLIALFFRSRGGGYVQ